ncbi:efflux RND transporter periplasmic adaptor subunit [Halopseudomonas sp.]|uniref:efflux RND transporter periplasmic adaptor subunit n=1 Tax=Halopseudomonas sp. TaxID=2901191 RepID=UPI003002334A
MSLPQSSPRSLRNWLLLAAAVAGAGTFAWFQFGSQTAPVQPDALRRMGWDAPAVVRVEPAALGQLDVQIKSIGTVTPLNTVTVQSRVSGVLEKVVFEEGARVEQGALLAEIDPLPYRAQLEQAEGQLQQNRAKLENARADLKLYEQLWEQDSIARQQLSDQRALVQELLGTVRANQAQVDDARLQLSWTRITAPLSGRLGLRKVDQGNLVTGSEAEGLVSITQTQPIAVNFTVPEVDVPALRDARRGDAPLKVEVLDRGEQRVLATGELTTLDNQIDTSTGTLRVRAQFANEDEALFPNQFVNVHLRLKTLESVVTIPGDAVQFGTERNYVYVVQDNKAYVRNVVLGAAADGRVAVTEGLEPGELVVLEGLDRLRDGKQVNIPDASGAAAGAARTPAAADAARAGQARPGAGERRGPPPAN